MIPTFEMFTPDEVPDAPRIVRRLRGRGGKAAAMEELARLRFRLRELGMREALAALAEVERLVQAGR